MLTVLVAIPVLFIALLAIPVMFSFQVSWQQGFQGQIHVQWAFGLVRFRLPTSQPGQTPTTSAGRSSRTRHKRKRQKKIPFPALVRAKDLRLRIFRYLSDCWHAIHKRNMHLRMRIGLGDPADTGQLWALLGPVAGMLSNYQEASLSIEPEFVDAGFELNGSGDIRVIPLQLIYLTGGLLLSPSFWLGIRQLRQDKV